MAPLREKYSKCKECLLWIMIVIDILHVAHPRLLIGQQSCGGGGVYNTEVCINRTEPVQAVHTSETRVSKKNVTYLVCVEALRRIFVLCQTGWMEASTAT